MEYLKGLNKAQKQAVLHSEGPLLIVAGAGAGKTKTITHRMAQLISQGVPAQKLLAVTFTNKAAGEMRERVEHLLRAGETLVRQTPYIATFHGLCVRLLREFGPEIGIPRSFVIWDRDDSTRAVKVALKSMGLDERYAPRMLVSTISKEKGRGVTIDAYAAKIRSPYERDVADAWKHYEAAQVRESALDFDDLLLKTLRMLQTRPLVLEALHTRWTYITIDEYQDTNLTQYEIARLLAAKYHNICVVGDTDQNIYSWRGADIAHLLSFEITYTNACVILLEQNYRSTQTILTAANAVIEKNSRRHPKRLYTDNPTGDAIVLHPAYDEQAEARFVAQSTRELLGSGVPASDIAVLYRENFQSRALEEAFIGLGIPYRVLGTRFFERAEVKDVLSYLRAALNPESRNDIARIVSSPPRGIGKQTLEKMLLGEDETLPGAARTKVATFRELLRTINNSALTKNASETVALVVSASGLEKKLREGDEEDLERLQNIRELVSLAVRYDQYEAPEGVERLLEDAALMSEQDSLAERQNAVSLMTVHASKGLEFDAIFVTGLEQGLFPSIRDEEGRDSEEERRLFYVAITRARRNLYLTNAASRLRYGTREHTVPSEFLDDIDPRLVKKETFSPLSREKTASKRGILDMYEDEDTIR